jgi:hypothetical protein
MALFAVTLNDETTDLVEGADAYQQEGPLTTFFAFQSNRRVIDSWSIRMASYRTADIAAIRRAAEAAPPADPVSPGAPAGSLRPSDQAVNVLVPV